MEVTTIGIDLAKRVFAVCGADSTGRIVWPKQLRRSQMLGFFARLKPCLVGMEACGGAHWWARQLSALGHTVKLMSPALVAPYRSGPKHDANDAAAACEAVTRPQLRGVAIKSVAQQDLLALHRLRTVLVKHATACANQLRALLHERGLVVARGAAALQRMLANLPQDNADLSGEFRGLLVDLGQCWRQTQARVAQLEAQIKRHCAQDERCQRLEQVVGVGPLTASALVATVGNAREFKSGRELSAYLGLVPRQHSSGGKTVLLGISKHGNRYLRTLLIHGARSALRTCGRRDDPQSRWMAATLQRRGPNVAAVAVANKHARIAWALLRRGERYRAVLRSAPSSADAAVKRVRDVKLLIRKD